MSTAQPHYDLIQRHFDGVATEAEEAELGRSLVADVDVADAFARAARLRADLSSVLAEDTAQSDAVALASDAALRYRHTIRPAWPLRMRRVAVAAVVLLAIGLAGWLLWPQRTPPGRSTGEGERQTAAQVVSGQVLVNGASASEVPPGATISVRGDRPAVLRLADGSQATFNLATRAVLHGRSGELRQFVELLNGAGAFAVEKAQRQFAVTTAVGRVVAVGTRFTVQCRQKDRPQMMVEVESGTVEVHVRAKVIPMEAGQRRTFNREGDAMVQ